MKVDQLQKHIIAVKHVTNELMDAQHIPSLIASSGHDCKDLVCLQATLTGRI